MQKLDGRSIMNVHNMAPLRRWVGAELVRRKTLLVSDIIEVFNVYMNVLDSFN